MLAGIMLFFSVFCFGQNQIQVGAFRERASAEIAINRLRGAGLNPVSENIMGLTRVRLTGVNSQQVPALLKTLRSLGFSDPWVEPWVEPWEVEEKTASFSAPWGHAQNRQAYQAVYRIQVGIFTETANAEIVFKRLWSAGLNPSYEYHSGYTRVVIPGVEFGNIRPLVRRINNAGFSDVWILRSFD